MIRFVREERALVLEYTGEFGGGRWVWTDLQEKGEVIIGKAFCFKKADLLNPPFSVPHDDLDEYEFRFRIGRVRGNYFEIPARALDIDNDLLIASDMPINRKTFIAERGISIFSRLSNLMENEKPIVIGGEREDAIPGEVFAELQKKFPTTTELNRYADARVSMVLSQYVDGMKDARGAYETHLNKRMASAIPARIDIGVFEELELQKYEIIRDQIAEWLRTKPNVDEGTWQQLMLSFLLLLFPKYIKVLENVTISDYYSNPEKVTPRYIDIALVDANGHLDVIEVKKPFDDTILRKSQYRGNSIPTSELSGSIMQAEKYLFHLSKWGVKGETALTKKYADELPEGMSIRISNPKAIIIVGRDQIKGNDMTGQQLLDFEVIKRKYANMIDIITYDDLLRRLNNTIAALRKSVAKSS